MIVHDDEGKPISVARKIRGIEYSLRITKRRIDELVAEIAWVKSTNSYSVDLVKKLIVNLYDEQQKKISSLERQVAFLMAMLVSGLCLLILSTGLDLYNHYIR